jgi:hypothetical protein
MLKDLILQPYTEQQQIGDNPREGCLLVSRNIISSVNTKRAVYATGKMRLNPSSSYHFAKPHTVECVDISALSLTGEKIMVNVMHVLVLMLVEQLFLL